MARKAKVRIDELEEETSAVEASIDLPEQVTEESNESPAQETIVKAIVEHDATALNSIASPNFERIMSRIEIEQEAGRRRLAEKAMGR